MQDRRRRVGAAVAIVLAMLLTAGAVGWELSPAAHASPVHVDATGSVAVTTSAPFMFNPNAFEMVPTNATITVTVTDADTLAHTFSILKLEGTVLPFPSANIPAYFSKYGALFTANVTGSGDVVTGTFTSPGVGWYEFVCQEPGHFASGMYGFIAFGENLPGNLTVSTAPTGPGAAVFIIIGTIVSLVVIAIVLGFVVGKRRGSEFEMPPERLGYAEPPTPIGNAPPTDGYPPHPPP
jgi:uncharacterized cupredoxin-like copper-binding protein